MKSLIAHVTTICLATGCAIACNEIDAAPETVDLRGFEVRPLSPAQLESLQIDVREERELREYMETIRREARMIALAMKLDTPSSTQQYLGNGAQEDMMRRLQQEIRGVALAMKIDTYCHQTAAPDQIQDATGLLSGRPTEISIHGIENAMALAARQWIVNSAWEYAGELDAGKTLECILRLIYKHGMA
jgi:hypothetical protein